MIQAPIIIEVRGGPHDGEKFTIDLADDTQEPIPNPTFFNVPLHLIEPGRYYVRWEDVEALDNRPTDYLIRKAELIQRMLDEEEG